MRRKPNCFKLVHTVALVTVWVAITFIAFRHQQPGERPGGAPTIHALCPFGGLATLHQTIAQGEFIQTIEEHWTRKPLVPNRLRAAVEM